MLAAYLKLVVKLLLAVAVMGVALRFPPDDLLRALAKLWPLLLLLSPGE
jgi:hypothetical protein